MKGTSLEEGDTIIQLAYEDEAERKRVEYAINNDENVESFPVRGYVRVLRGEDDDIKELLEKADSKTEIESDFNYGTFSESNQALSNDEHVRWDYNLTDNHEHLDFYLEGIMDKGLDRGATPKTVSENHIQVRDRELGTVSLKFNYGADIEDDLQVHIYGMEGTSDIYGEALANDMEPRFGIESVEKTALGRNPDFI